MTDNSPRKTGTLSIDGKALPKTEWKSISEDVDEPDNSTFGKQETPEAMVPVKVLRGYWPKGKPGDFEPTNPLVKLIDGEKPGDPKRIKLKTDALCMLPETEAQAAADNGIVRILTAKGYRDAQEAAAVAPPPPSPRTTIIEKTA